MTITPALSNGIVGRVQAKISQMLYLDRKDSEFIHHELELFALDLMKIWEQANEPQQDMDPADTQGHRGVP